MCLVFFFFKQKTAYEMRISDWSSDVCSSDLSLYAFDTLKFGAHFMVSGGVRIDHYKTDYLATAACNTEGTGTDSRRTVYCSGADIGTVLTTTDASDSDTLFNWKLGVLYKPVEAASIYAHYSLSQQPPGGAT